MAVAVIAAPRSLSETMAGLTTIEVRVWFTVTLTELVVPEYQRPAAGLTIVTWKLYVPALLNVATVFLAALVPLTLNVTGAGGVPMVDHE